MSGPAGADTGPTAEVVRTIPDADQLPAGTPVRTIEILQAPVRLWDRSTTHTAELMREFALLTIGSESGTTRHVPDRLLGVVADLRARYAGISARQAEQVERAVTAGELTLDVSYQVPPCVAEACQTLQDLLDEADEFCARGTALMTLVSPPDQQEFRRWYLQEFIRQSAGQPPTPWTGSTL